MWIECGIFVSFFLVLFQLRETTTYLKELTSIAYSVAETRMKIDKIEKQFLKIIKRLEEETGGT